jgi:hypothetical protein
MSELSSHVEVYAETHRWKTDNAGKRKLHKVRSKQVDVEYIGSPCQVFVNGKMVYDSEAQI